MAKKPFIIFVAVIVFAYGLETVRLTITYENYFHLVWSGISFTAAISLLLNKLWSQYLIYLLALLISIFFVLCNWRRYCERELALRHFGGNNYFYNSRRLLCCRIDWL